MKIKANLFIDQRGSLRITKKDTSAYPTELAVQLVVDVPDSFFKRPVPKVELSIPESFLVSPDHTVKVRWVAENISESLGLEVKAVEDGLLALLK